MTHLVAVTVAAVLLWLVSRHLERRDRKARAQQRIEKWRAESERQAAKRAEKEHRSALAKRAERWHKKA